MSKKRKKKRKAGIGNLIIIVVAVAVIAVSLSKLIPILLDYKQADQTYENLEKEYVTEEEYTGGSDSDEAWWAYAVQIDFHNLKQINPDVIGWIRFDNVDEIPVNYPIMYSGDNDTYLKTDLYGEAHSSGSIFLEAANAPDFSDCYNIIYGHNMKNGSMFGTLKQYKRNEDFYDANAFFTIYTERGAYRYQIFAYEDVPENSEIYTVGYIPDQVYQGLIDRMVSDSLRDTGICPDKEDSIVTLSTCSTSGEHYRFVVHAVCVGQKLYQ